MPIEDAIEATTEVLVKLTSETELARTEPVRTKLTRTEPITQVKIRQPKELKVLLIAVRY